MWDGPIVGWWHNSEQAQRFTSAGLWTDKMLFEIVEDWADRQPGKLAVADGVRAWSYRELVDFSKCAATVLARLGVAPGGAVLVQGENTALLVGLHFAINRLGAIFVPAPAMWREAELVGPLQASRATVMLVPDDPQALERAERLRAGCPSLTHILALTGSNGLEDRARTAEVNEALLAGIRPSPNDPLSVICSSGTTGVPKVSAFSNNNLFATITHQIAPAVGLTRDDIVGAIAPVNTGSTGYVYGVLCPLVTGGTSHILSRWTAPNALDLLAANSCTCAVAIPTQIVMMLDLDVELHNLTSLRVVLNSGASLAPAAAAQFETRLDCRVLGVYGASDAAIPATVRWDDPEDKRRETVGRTAPGQEVRIVSPDGSTLPAGEPGEVIWRGPNKSFGFLAQPDHDASAWDAEKFFHSGDIGFIDDDEYLRIVGRLKDMILRGGHNIFPIEIESALHELESVLDVAVVGIPDTRLGERTCAVVVLKEGAELELVDVTTFLTARGFAKYKLPEKLVRVAELPRNAAAKLDKPTIRNMALQAL